MTKRAFFLRILSILMVIALVAVIIVYLAGSSGSEKPIDEVAAPVISLFENEKSEHSQDRMFKKHYSFNAQDYDGVVLYSPVSNMDAEELLIVKLAEEDQAEELVAAVESRLDSQMNVFEGYAPQPYALCQNAIIDLQGNYLLFVVHENATLIDDAFRSALK